MKGDAPPRRLPLPDLQLGFFLADITVVVHIFAIFDCFGSDDTQYAYPLLMLESISLSYSCYIERLGIMLAIIWNHLKRNKGIEHRKLFLE